MLEMNVIELRPDGGKYGSGLALKWVGLTCTLNHVILQPAKAFVLAPPPFCCSDLLIEVTALQVCAGVLD